MPRRILTQWFKDSRASKIKIHQSRVGNNWKQLVKAVELLKKSQKERVSCSKNGRRVQVIDSHEAYEAISEGGRYLVRPPLVGRDAATLQESLDEKGLAAVVLCREPVTQLGLCPVVTLGATTIVRACVEEPSNPNKPTAEWFDSAVDELGRTVVDKADTLETLDRKLDYLIGHLGAVPCCERLYDVIITICDTLDGASE